MGSEFAQMREWRCHAEVDWFLLQYPMHDSARRYSRDLNLVLLHEPALYELDHDPDGFAWIDANNKDQSVFSFVRYAANRKDHVVVVLNMTPVVHHHFRIGVPSKGTYTEIINSDKAIYGGSNQYNGLPAHTSDIPFHGRLQSIQILLPPLGITILKWKKS